MKPVDRSTWKLLDNWMGEVIRAARRTAGWSFVYTTEVMRRNADWVIEQYRNSKRPQEVCESLLIRVCEGEL